MCELISDEFLIAEQLTKRLFLLACSGSGSARAALVSDKGEIVAESVHETLTRRDDRDSNIFEQSTEQSA